MDWLLLGACILTLAAAGYAVWYAHVTKTELSRTNDWCVEKLRLLNHNDKSIHLVLVSHKQHIEQLYEMMDLVDGPYMAFDSTYTKMEQ